jgi:hypothetical protein
MKRTVPLFIAAITGFVVIIAYFIPYTEKWGEYTMIWFDILAAIAFILGGGNLLKMNLQKVSSRRAGWGFALVTVIAFVATLIICMGKIGVMPSDNFPQYAWSGAHDQEGGWMSWIYEYMYRPLQSTMFSLLAFYVASAAFRAFRAKNVEAAVLLGTAFIVLLGRTYAGIFLTGWVDGLVDDETPSVISTFVTNLRLDRLTSMIMNVFNLAGLRAITIGIALGIVSTSLKVLLGVDRSYLGSDGE